MSKRPVPPKNSRAMEVARDRGIDLAMLEANLRLTPIERIRRHDAARAMVLAIAAQRTSKPFHNAGHSFARGENGNRPGFAPPAVMPAGLITLRARSRSDGLQESNQGVTVAGIAHEQAAGVMSSGQFYKLLGLGRGIVERPSLGIGNHFVIPPMRQ